jgi:hypothetical protein
MFLVLITGCKVSRPELTAEFPRLKCSLEGSSVFMQDASMDRLSVIRTLREHESELRAAGIMHLRLFGSLARDESSPESDIDLLAEFDRTKRLSLVRIGSLQSRLSELLGAEVDLSSAEWMREPIRSRALREAILAF